jgi:hypothetical protein
LGSSSISSPTKSDCRTRTTADDDAEDAALAALLGDVLRAVVAELLFDDMVSYVAGFIFSQ